MVTGSDHTATVGRREKIFSHQQMPTKYVRVRAVQKRLEFVQGGRQGLQEGPTQVDTQDNWNLYEVKKSDIRRKGHFY